MRGREPIGRCEQLLSASSDQVIFQNQDTPTPLDRVIATLNQRFTPLEPLPEPFDELFAPLDDDLRRIEREPVRFLEKVAQNGKVQVRIGRRGGSADRRKY